VILEKIRQTYPQLTKSQKKLADYIAGAYQEAAFLSASRLARRLGVNEATVIRFAQRLGYAGYPELAQDVRALVLDELCVRGEGGRPAAEATLLTCLERQVQALRRAISHVAPELADRVLSAVRGARRIYVAGEGISCHLAEVLACGLSSQGLDAWAVPAGADGMVPVLARIGPDDLLIGICLGEGVEVANALAFARQRGARTVVLARSAVCRAAQVAELALSCASDGDADADATGVLAGFLAALVRMAAEVESERRRQFFLAQDAARRALRGA